MIMATLRIINTHFSSSAEKRECDKNSIPLASGYHESDVRNKEKRKQRNIMKVWGRARCR